jgi:hypothetical protein
MTTRILDKKDLPSSLASSASLLNKARTEMEKYKTAILVNSKALPTIRDKCDSFVGRITGATKASLKDARVTKYLDYTLYLIPDNANIPDDIKMMMSGLRNKDPSKNEEGKMKELKYMISMLYEKLEQTTHESTTKEQAIVLLDDAIANARELETLFSIASEYAAADYAAGKLRGGSRKRTHRKRKHHKRRTQRKHRK